MDGRAILTLAASVLAGASFMLGGLWLWGELHGRGPELLEVRWDTRDLDRPDAPAGAPNVVLVIGCTLRRDQMSVYGGPAGTTPFLEALAADGVRFDDMVAAAPWTRAASTALLTGRHALAIGMIDRTRGRSERRLPESVTTLAELLRDHGYATAGITLNPNLNDVYGFAQGFDGYLQLAKLWRERAVKVPSEAALSELDALLDGVPSGRPVFLQAMFIDAHSPIHATDKERARFEDPTVPERVVTYRAGVAAFDATVRELRARLEARGLTRDNTLFMVVNDHGEGLSFPHNHGPGHGRYLAPSTVGGVWILIGPGLPGGHVVHGVASQVDLLPTVAGLLALPLVDERAAANPEAPALPGRDWSALVRGHGDRTDRVVAFSDTWFRDVNRAAAYRSDRACQLDFGLFQAIRAGFVDGCFDRATDPEHARPGRDAGLTYVLRTWRERAVAEGQAFGDAPEIAPDASLSRQLEALGYLDGEPPP